MFHCTYFLHFIYSFISVPLDGFELLVIVNNFVKNTEVQTSLCISAFTSFGVYPEVKLLDCMVILLLYYLFTYFEEPPWCFPQQLYHLLFLPAIHNSSNFYTFLLMLAFLKNCFWFLKIVILLGMKFLIMVFICVSLMFSEAELFLMHSLDICISSLEKYFFSEFLSKIGCLKIGCLMPVSELEEFSVYCGF